MIKRIFLNVSMVNRIDGLRVIAKKHGIDLKEMEAGDYLFFVNSGRDKIAALVGPQGADGKDGLMAYSRLDGRRVDMRAIKYLPKCFNGKSINYDLALEAVIDNELKQKKKKFVVHY